MKRKRPSLVGRAILAIVLMIGFYVLAIGIAAGLLYLPYAEIKNTEQLHIKLVLFCLCSAGAILWAILPRPDLFKAPGPSLQADTHPRLFRELTSIAQSVKQAMPSEVYLIPNVNAWVSQRGGVMGLGGRRVMGLGLPLMKVLKISELRAVLAHEFGHYHGGDTALAPWVYKTRIAIIRTLENLGNGLIQKPFMCYGKIFLRITHAISRQQEYAADALAAEIAGTNALISGLQVVYTAGTAFDDYWRGEVAPLISAGYRPPITDGFAAFLHSEPIIKRTTEVLAKEMTTANHNPYDTHPPLKDRVAALASESAISSPENDPAAITLIEDVDGLEREMLASAFGEDGNHRLKDIRWEDARKAVYMPAWQKQCNDHVLGLSGIHLGMLPDIVLNRAELISRFQSSLSPALSDEEMTSAVTSIIGSAVALALRNGRFTNLLIII